MSNRNRLVHGEGYSSDARATALTRRLRRRIADRDHAEPSASQWRAMGESFFAGDPLMDRVVDWMAAHGVHATKPLFDAAVERGIAGVPDAPDALRALFAHVERRPPWSIRRGSRRARAARASRERSGSTCCATAAYCRATWPRR